MLSQLLERRLFTLKVRIGSNKQGGADGGIECAVESTSEVVLVVDEKRRKEVR